MRDFANNYYTKFENLHSKVFSTVYLDLHRDSGMKAKLVFKLQIHFYKWKEKRYETKSKSIIHK